MYDSVLSSAHLVAILGTHFDKVAAVAAAGMCFGLDLAILQRCEFVILEELAPTAAAALARILQHHLLQRMRVEEQTPAMTVVLFVQQHAHLATIEGELAAKRGGERERERDNQLVCSPQKQRNGQSRTSQGGSRAVDTLS